MGKVKIQQSVFWKSRNSLICIPKSRIFWFQTTWRKLSSQPSCHPRRPFGCTPTIPYDTLPGKRRTHSGIYKFRLAVCFSRIINSRLTIAMACSMDFRFYPADTQSCNFDIKSCKHKFTVRFSMLWGFISSHLPAFPDAYSDSKMVLAWVEKNGAFFAYPVALSNFFVGLDNPNAFTHKTTSREIINSLSNTCRLCNGYLW